MNIIDKVLGNMTYDCGWIKEINVHIFNHDYLITCVLSAYSGQEILDVQREQYIKFINNQEKIQKQVEMFLQTYYIKEISDDVVNISKHLYPTEIIFQRDSSYGILFECDWDIENGIVITIEPQLDICTQDLFL